MCQLVGHKGFEPILILRDPRRICAAYLHHSPVGASGRTPPTSPHYAARHFALKLRGIFQCNRYRFTCKAIPLICAIRAQPDRNHITLNNPNDAPIVGLIAVVALVDVLLGDWFPLNVEAPPGASVSVVASCLDSTAAYILKPKVDGWTIPVGRLDDSMTGRIRDNSRRNPV